MTAPSRNIAHYTRALMAELLEHGEAVRTIDDYFWTESKARNRMFLAARYAGLRITTQKIGNRVHATVLVDLPVLDSEARL